MTTSAHTPALTAADLLEGRAEIIRDDNRDGYYVADKHGAIAGLVEQSRCGCCWTVRMIDGDQVVTLNDTDDAPADLDDALAQLAYGMGRIDVEELELVTL